MFKKLQMVVGTIVIVPVTCISIWLAGILWKATFWNGAAWLGMVAETPEKQFFRYD